MKVLGYTDEITACDCCGKSNLRGTFAIATDAGDTLHYGSVCVNRVYGNKRGDSIKTEATKIAAVRAGTWEQAVDKYSRGHFGGFFLAYMGDKPTSNNSAAQMRAVTSIRNWKTGQVIRQRA